jgi:hypothetical protein
MNNDITLTTYNHMCSTVTCILQITLNACSLALPHSIPCTGQQPYVTLSATVHNHALRTTIQKAGRLHSIWYCNTASLVGFPTRQGIVTISRRYVPQIITPNAAVYFPTRKNKYRHCNSKKWICESCHTFGKYQ